MSVAVVTGARSDRGTVRENNEDSGYSGRRLALVADGVGGNAAGEVASGLVIRTLQPLDDQPVLGDPEVVLGDAVRRAQRALSDHATAHPATAGMATTLTALLVTDHDLVLAHVGDSRAYLRPCGGELRQVTRDDTYVQLLVDAGHITGDQAETHPMRHVITGSLSANGSTDAEGALALTRHPARAGDRWLLCSDGLSGVLSLETIAWVVDEEPASWPCAARLVELALRAGATDNVTAVVVDVVREGCVLPFPPRLVGAAGAAWTGPDPYDDVA